MLGKWGIDISNLMPDLISRVANTIKIRSQPTAKCTRSSTLKMEKISQKKYEINAPSTKVYTKLSRKHVNIPTFLLFSFSKK